MDNEINKNELNHSKVLEEVPSDSDNVKSKPTNHCNPSTIPKAGSSVCMRDVKCKEIPETVPHTSRRSSVCKLFDPLHKKNINFSASKEKKIQNDNNATVEIVEKVICDDVDAGKSGFKTVPPENLQYGKDILNKNMSNIHNANTLMSFESPKKFSNPSIPKTLFPTTPSKKYTQEEYDQILLNQKLRLLKEFSQKYAECDMRFTEKALSLEREIRGVAKQMMLINVTISELLGISEEKSKNIRDIKTKIKDLFVENERLELDIATSKEDLSNSETAFADFSKRYEQCKAIIKAYKENEEHFAKKIQSLEVAVKEQTSKNCLMESRTQDIMDKAAIEVDAAKKSSAKEIAILEAELKKAHMKILSLENDLEQGRSVKETLSNIYDGLVSKLQV